MQNLVFFVGAAAVWIAAIAAVAVFVQRWRAGGSERSLADVASVGTLRSQEMQDADDLSIVSAVAVSTDNEPQGEEPAGDAVANGPPALLRYPYPTQQWAAPCVHGRLPSEDNFFRVASHELYDGGISFLSPIAIEAETLVISLGNRDTLVFMLARRLSQQPQIEEHESLWLVECQFIRRVREDAGRWARALKAVPAACAT